MVMMMMDGSGDGDGDDDDDDEEDDEDDGDDEDDEDEDDEAVTNAHVSYEKIGNPVKNRNSYDFCEILYPICQIIFIFVWFLMTFAPVEPFPKVTKTICNCPVLNFATTAILPTTK